MSRYISDRPCPIHGSIVERYIKDNRCCACHAHHQQKRKERKLAKGMACPHCGGTDFRSDGRCKKCFEEYLLRRQFIPCPVCGQTNRNPKTGRCQECTKDVFYRKVPAHAREEMIAFLKAVNLVRGIKNGAYSFGGVRYDSENYDLIVPFLMELKARPA